MDSAEPAILFQTLSGDGGKGLKNLWFIIHPPTAQGIFDAFRDFDQKEKEKTSNKPESLLVEVSSTFVGSRLYTVGGRQFMWSSPSNNISYLDIRNRSLGWNRDSLLPHPLCDSILGVHGDALFILPSPDPEWYCNYNGIPFDKYSVSVKGYIWNIKEKKTYVIKAPKCGDGGNREWNTIRACAPEGKGFLIAIDGDQDNFYVHNGEPESDWDVFKSMDPLPKFHAPTSFGAKNGRLYILRALGEPPARLYIYDIKEKKFICNALDIPFSTFDIKTWRSDMHVIPLSADKISFVWLGHYRGYNRDLYHMQVQVLFNPKPNIQVLIKEERFATSIVEISRCLPYDLQGDLDGKTPVYTPLPPYEEPKESISQEMFCMVDRSKLCTGCLAQVVNENPSE